MSKIIEAIKENKKKLIVAIILWLLITIVFVVPLTLAIYAANLKGSFDQSVFINILMKSMGQPFDAFGTIAKRNQIELFMKIEIGFTLVYGIVSIIGILKSKPKHEYRNIEHGSSDWSRRGEQYSILNKNEGIILAENNYLPVDKRGNVNVLVVGRIRFW